MTRILVVFSSIFGAGAHLAKSVAQTLESSGAQVRVRGVKQIVLAKDQVPLAKAPLASEEDLAWAQGLVFISPSHTGLLSAAMKAFVDEHHDSALSGTFLNKTFTAIATSKFAHAGQERVVDELNAIGAAWGCILVPPSTAISELNALDGNPYGLSFVLDQGKLPTSESFQEALRIHLDRFLAVTAALEDLQAQTQPAGPTRKRYTLAKSFQQDQ